MEILKKYSLLLRLIAGILIGILIGMLDNEILVRIFATFNDLFGQLLNFTIPLIILAFITYGISNLKTKSKNLLAATVGISYSSTIIMGTFAYFVASTLLPDLLAGKSIADITARDVNMRSYITGLKILPLMDVMTALVLAFIIGIGLAMKGSPSTLKTAFEDFHNIVSSFVSKVIIPLLPIFIAGTFAKMSYAGKVGAVMSSFLMVFILAISMHIIALCVQYTIAGTISKKNPFILLKNMVPAYVTAVGTQSSAATIPVTSQSIKNNGVKPQIAEFVSSLCATIHLSGSMITITTCSIAVMILSGYTFSITSMIPFILILGVMMVAAPGLPGGAIMAAVGILQSSLGFNEGMTALMITLYLAQDSFGTACNVTGDGAIAVIVDKIADK